ncbi:hypothetical protein BDW74DRAFT_172142 [Aspergillus multicolor]|uniref:uncharacterized protein n=1 Tax=Aspergillus multicolor TaxID=41759 RepID=UPI003CCDE3B3
MTNPARNLGEQAIIDLLKESFNFDPTQRIELKEYLLSVVTDDYFADRNFQELSNVDGLKIFIDNQINDAPRNDHTEDLEGNEPLRVSEQGLEKLQGKLRTSPKNVERVLRFFKLREGHGDLIKLPWFKNNQGLLLHQASAVIDMCNYDAIRNGGALADEVGMGDVRTDVESSRRRQDGQHLPEGSNEARCPSAASFLLECCCMPNSATSKMKSAHEGATLVMVPPAIFGDWIKAWSALVQDPSRLFQLKLIAAHDNHDTGHGPLASHRDHLTIKEAKDIATARAYQVATRIYQYTDETSSVSQKRRELLQQYEAARTNSGPPFGTLPSAANDYVVLTTAASYKSQVVEKLEVKHKIPTRDGLCSPTSIWGRHRSEPWCSIICHESSDAQTFVEATGIMANVPGRPPCWMVHAALFAEGLKKSEAFIKILARPSWNNHPTLRQATPDKIKRLAEQFAELQDTLDADFGPITDQLAAAIGCLGFISRRKNIST